MYMYKRDMYKKICITNRHLVNGDYIKKIEQILKKDIDYIILREKDLSESEYYTLAQQVIALAGNKCILHNFVSVAEKLGHNKIHLSMEEFMKLSYSQKLIFDTIGVSTHTVQEAISAQQNGATYITASHIFATDCKKNLAPRGLNYLSEVKSSISIPVYALGGINPTNQDLCLKAGADGICMMSEYMK